MRDKDPVVERVIVAHGLSVPVTAKLVATGDGLSV